MTDIPNLKQLRYATDPGRIDEPEEGKKDTGFVTRESPSPVNWNWLQNKSFERFKFLQGGENHHVVGSQAQKDNFTADLLLAEVTNANLANHDKIVFLQGNHYLTANTVWSRNHLEFFRQTGSAYIYLVGHTLTMSGQSLRGIFSIVDAVPNSIIISGSNIEGLEIRTPNPAAVDFKGSGTIIVNGKLISKELITLEISNQPDRVLLTASEQNLYSNDDRFVRYSQATQTFLRKDDAPVAIPDGAWVVVNNLETLSAGPLVFNSDRLKINCYRGFQLNLGNQGDNIPYAAIIKGHNCDVSLNMTQSIRELATILGDDKLTPMSNGLTAMENRRVIKNQGEHNRIVYNNEQVFSGGPPVAAMDFVRPNHPYLLEWDGFIYEGLNRYPSFDNRDGCWFSDLYYWLDRRFNIEVPDPDLALIYHTVTVPPRSPNFIRPLNLDDPDRHSREANPWEMDYTIPGAEYSQVSDKIILGGNPNAAVNIRNVKNGQRVSGPGLPSILSNTTLVRPGSIVVTPGSESFLLMDAEDNSAVTAAATGALTLNFSGMAAGSYQEDTFQNIIGSVWHKDTNVTDPFFELFPFGAFGQVPHLGSLDDRLSTSGNVEQSLLQFNASDSPGARTSPADENRPVNNLGAPYYKL